MIWESRNYRTLQGWLLAKHPDLFAEFTAFNRRLKRTYPSTKDLSTTPMFKDLVSRGTGTFLTMSRLRSFRLIVN